MSGEQDTLDPNVWKNALRLLADVGIAPGTSLIVKGDLRSGAGHVVAGLVARSFLGPIGWIAVAANSYAKSIAGSGQGGPGTKAAAGPTAAHGHHGVTDVIEVPDMNMTHDSADRSR